MQTQTSTKNASATAGDRERTQELVNRVEASLRGLDYHETLRDGSFLAVNHSQDFWYGCALTHIDGKRHERSVNSANLLSSLYRALVHSFDNVSRGKSNMALVNGLIWPVN